MNNAERERMIQGALVILQKRHQALNNESYDGARSEEERMEERAMLQRHMDTAYSVLDSITTKESAV